MNVSNLLDVSSISGYFSKISRSLGSSVGPWSQVILATSVTSLVALGFYHWKYSSHPTTSDSKKTFEMVKEKVCKAYAYVFGGIAITAVSAALSHMNGLSLKILQNKYLATGISLLSMGSLIGIDYIKKDDFKLKHLAWTIFNIGMGIVISPIGFVDKAIIAQAAAISIGMGGILSLTSILAPDEKFMKWEGPLMACLLGLSTASLVAFFFPQSAFAYLADRASLYGGLALFCGFFMVSTQRLLKEAKTQTDEVFDPLKASLNIYLDLMNIFVRVFRLLVEDKKNKES